MTHHPHPAAPALLLETRFLQDAAPGQPLAEDQLLRLWRWLGARTTGQLIAITTLAALAARVAGMPLVMLAQALFGESTAGPGLDDASLFKVIAAAVVLAPLIETLICQLLVQHLLGKIPALRARRWIPILISGLLFAAGHWYSISYIANTLGIGVVLALAFQVAGPAGRGFWVVAVSHGCLNLLFTLDKRSGLLG
jgi:hypothetical protein